MTERQAIFPANRHALYEAHGYSAAIRSGDLLFVSGQVGSRADGSPEPDFEQQVKLAFDNLKATLNAAGSALEFSTYLGGSSSDYGIGIFVDAAGNTYVTGDTFSENFPTLNPLDGTWSGNFTYDAFAVKIDNATTSADLTLAKAASPGMTALLQD